MWLVKVTGHPFSIDCKGCGKRVVAGDVDQRFINRQLQPVFADCHGEPFKAYYCNQCQTTLTNERASKAGHATAPSSNGKALEQWEALQAAKRRAQERANRTGSSVLVYRVLLGNPNEYGIDYTLPAFGESVERIYPDEEERKRLLSL